MERIKNFMALVRPMGTAKHINKGTCKKIEGLRQRFLGAISLISVNLGIRGALDM